MFLSSNFHGLKFRGVVGVLALVGAGHAAMGAATEVGKLFASDGMAEDSFGRAVAIDGDVAIVGAPDKGVGAAYIYRFDGVSWLEEAVFTDPDGAPGDGFGISVDISGDVAIVGAWQHESTGAAYIFRFDGAGWVEEDKRVASDGVAADHFGLAVAIDGDIAVVGADQPQQGVDPPVLLYPGAAYVYEFDGDWDAETKLVASDGEAGDQFGCAVDIDGGVIVVGARFGDSAAADSGAAYVFSGSNWVVETKLTASDAALNDHFGESVSMSGDVIAIGSPLHDPGVADGGAVFIFAYDGAAWSVEDKLVLGGPGGENFGAAVAVSGDLLVVGAPLQDTQTGFVYPFRFDGATWVGGTETLSASDFEALDHFGGAIGISSEERIIVGAAGNDDLGNASGSAYVFELLDTDGDGLTDYDELVFYEDLHPCLNPFDSDTDGDGLEDGTEVTLYVTLPAIYDPCTNPAITDADRDGLSDTDEDSVYLTDPLSRDTDTDGLNDGHEVYLADGSGCPNPLDPDSDDDGALDGNDTEPCSGGAPVDTDGDGLTDDDEIYIYGTDPLDDDSDDDGLLDGEEVDVAVEGCPDPLNPDSDGDGLDDGEEVALTTDPCNADTDGDGVGDDVDPEPTVPGVPQDFLAEWTMDVSNDIRAVDLDLFTGANDFAKGLRQAVLSGLTSFAAILTDFGYPDLASAYLTLVYQRVDGASPPQDWMVDSPEKAALADEIDLLIALLALE
jgi:hypothetical protein